MQAYGSFAILRGSIAMTAASGDKATATCTGTCTCTCSFITAVGALLQIGGFTYGITGGAGRLEGARAQGGWKARRIGRRIRGAERGGDDFVSR